VADEKSLERVKRIIRELRNKTTERGCTEEEALAAAKMMGDLLEKHDLEMDEVGLKEETAACTKNIVRAADDYASNIIVGIGSFCDLIAYRSKPGEFTFFGTPHDLEIGLYLFEVCAEAMDYGWSEYMEIHGYSMKKRASYRMGFAGRVTARLRELKAARAKPTGTALIVLKDQLVKSEWSKEGIKLQAGAKRYVADMGAFREGTAAGGRVNLNNPLTGGGGSAGQIR